MCPNMRQEEGPPLEHSYIVTAAEVANLSLVAKLVVLSCGWSTSPREGSSSHLYFLPSAFLAAGLNMFYQIYQIGFAWCLISENMDEIY